jgi:hypothetical protein
MAGNGRIYMRGEIFFVAYSDHGREFRESTRSRNVEDAKRLLEQRLAACRPLAATGGAGVPFDDLCQRYLDEYRIRQFRTPDTAGGACEKPARLLRGHGRRDDHHRASPAVPGQPAPGPRRCRDRQPGDGRVEADVSLGAGCVEKHSRRTD